jgi:hypothetical protein
MASPLYEPPREKPKPVAVRRRSNRRRGGADSNRRRRGGGVFAVARNKLVPLKTELSVLHRSIREAIDEKDYFSVDAIA